MASTKKRIAKLLPALLLICCALSIVHLTLFNHSDGRAQQFPEPDDSAYRPSPMGIGIALSLQEIQISISQEVENDPTHPNITTIVISELPSGCVRALQNYSLSENMHLAPPYSNDLDRVKDEKRRITRRFRKLRGFAASVELGVVGDAMRPAIAEAEDILGFKIDEAMISLPQLSAFYTDDLLDLYEYLGIKERVFDDDDSIRSPYDINAAFAAYGFGLPSASWWSDGEPGQSNDFYSVGIVSLEEAGLMIHAAFGRDGHTTERGARIRPDLTLERFKYGDKVSRRAFEGQIDLLLVNIASAVTWYERGDMVLGLYGSCVNDDEFRNFILERLAKQGVKDIFVLLEQPDRSLISRGTAELARIGILPHRLPPGGIGVVSTDGPRDWL